MKPIHWRPTKPTLFAILMVAAALLAVLPTRWTSCTDGVMQPVSPIAWLLSRGARRSRTAIADLAGPEPTRDELRFLQTENERLVRQVGQQSIVIAEMERVVADLSGLRDQFGDARARIVFASVVGRDASPHREVLTISKGARSGVARGDWVAAGVPSAQRSPTDTGRDLLLQQWIIGIVEEVQPHVSRVQLTTDPQFGTQLACVAQPLPDGTWRLAERRCGLLGLGRGRMCIDAAAIDHFADGYTIVMVPLAHPQPITLAVGRIVASNPLETGVHYELDVEPWGNAREVSHVYVISLSD